MRPEIPDALAERVEDVYERAGYSTPSALVRDATRQRVTVIEREGEQPPLVGLSTSEVDPGSEATPTDGGEQVTRPPFKDRTLQSEDGIVYGHNPFSDEEVRVNRFMQPAGNNALVLGDIGCGKTVSTVVQLKRELEARNDLRVVYIDRFGAGSSPAEETDSQVVRLGEDTGMNPLEVKRDRDHDAQVMSEQDVIREKAGAVTALVQSLPRSDAIREGSEIEMVLEEAVKQTLTDDTTGGVVQDATFADVREVLQHMANAPEEYTLGIGQNRTEEESVAEKSVQALHRTQHLADDGPEVLKTFARPTSFDIEDHRLTWIDLHSDDHSLPAANSGMVVAAEAAFEQARATEDDVIIALDNVEPLLKSTYGTELLRNLRHARHHDVGWHLVAQSLPESESAEQTKSLIENCSIKHLHRMEGIDRATVTMLDLADDEGEYVRQARPGNISDSSEADGSETLLMVGDKRVPTVVEAPNELMTDERHGD